MRSTTGLSRLRGWRLKLRWRTGFRFVFRHFPMTTVHPHAQSAAEAAEAAGSQRMFWQMRGTLFAADAPLTNSLLTAAAAAIGVDVPSFQEDLIRHGYLPRVEGRPLV